MRKIRYYTARVRGALCGQNYGNIKGVAVNPGYGGYANCLVNK